MMNQIFIGTFPLLMIFTEFQQQLEADHMALTQEEDSCKRKTTTNRNVLLEMKLMSIYG